MKIMFICTGNICRSAMAHCILEDKLHGEPHEVYSCGTYAEDGNESTFSAIEVMREYGLDLKNHRATNIRNSKIAEMDLILCMTWSHKNMAQQMYPELKDKIYTFKDYVKYDETGRDIDIKDPWGYDIEVYRFCASEIEKCINKLTKMIDNKK